MSVVESLFFTHIWMYLQSFSEETETDTRMPPIPAIGHDALPTR